MSKQTCGRVSSLTRCRRGWCLLPCPHVSSYSNSSASSFLRQMCQSGTRRGEKQQTSVCWNWETDFEIPFRHAEANEPCWACLCLDAYFTSGLLSSPNHLTGLPGEEVLCILVNSVISLSEFDNGALIILSVSYNWPCFVLLSRQLMTSWFPPGCVDTLPPGGAEKSRTPACWFIYLCLD